MYTFDTGCHQIKREIRTEKKYNNKTEKKMPLEINIHDFSFNFSHVVAPKALAKWSSTTDSVIEDVLLSAFDDVVNGQNLPSDRAKCSSIESTM